MIIYILLLFFPVFFLIRRGRKELASVICLIILFLLVHGLFLTGRQTVSWDTMNWLLYLCGVKGVLQSGHLPGWNPYFNCGEPFYLYNYAYMFWQWFLFVLLDYIWPAEPIILFNLFFVFLFIFYNVGCYLLFQKMFADKKVALFCFTVSLYATSFNVYFTENSSFYVSIYFPYLLYFFLEYLENQSRRSLVLLGGLTGMMSNCYLPQIPIIAFGVFVVCYLVFMRGRYCFPHIDKETLVYATAGVILLLLIASPCLYVFSQLSDYISPKRAGFSDIGSSYNQLIVGHHQEYSGIFNFIYPFGNRGILFIGFLPFILAVMGALKSSNRFHLVVLASAIVVFFINLGANSFSYILINYLPVFSLIKQYMAFEIFSQMFVICLAGMGLEYILGAKKENGKNLLILFSIVSLTVLLLMLKFAYKPVTFVLIKPEMYIVLFTVSIIGIYVLITHRTQVAFYFLFTMFVLCALSLQWYWGYRAINNIRDFNHLSAETKNLATLLERRVAFSWKEQRDISVMDGMRHIEHLIQLLEKIKKEIGQSGHCPDTLIVEVDRCLCSPEIYSIFKSHGYVPTLDENSLSICSDILKEPPPDLTKIADDILAKLQFLIAKNPQLFAGSVQEDNGLGGGRREKFLEHFNADIYNLDHAMNDCINAVRLGNMADAEAKLKFVEDAFTDMQRRLYKLQEAFSITDESTALSIFEDNFGKRVLRLRAIISLESKTLQNSQNLLGGRVQDMHKHYWGGDPMHNECRAWADEEGYATRYRRLILNIIDAEIERLEELKKVVGGRLLKVAFYKTFEPIFRDYELAYWEPVDEELLISGRYYRLYPLFRKRYLDYFGVGRPKLFVTTCFKILSEEKIIDEMDNNYEHWNETRTIYLPKDEIEQDSIIVWQNGKTVNDKQLICPNPEVISYGPNHLKVSVNSPSEAFLVYLQNYDRNWHAYINDKETKIYRANYSFQAIRINQGENHVDFRFESPYIYFFGLHLLGVTVTLTCMGIHFYNT